MVHLTLTVCSSAGTLLSSLASASLRARSSYMSFLSRSRASSVSLTRRFHNSADQSVSQSANVRHSRSSRIDHPKVDHNERDTQLSAATLIGWLSLLLHGHKTNTEVREVIHQFYLSLTPAEQNAALVVLAAHVCCFCSRTKKDKTATPLPVICTEISLVAIEHPTPFCST